MAVFLHPQAVVLLFEALDQLFQAGAWRPACCLFLSGVTWGYWVSTWQLCFHTAIEVAPLCLSLAASAKW